MVFLYCRLTKNSPNLKNRSMNFKDVMNGTKIEVGTEVSERRDAN